MHGLKQCPEDVVWELHVPVGEHRGCATYCVLQQRVLVCLPHKESGALRPVCNLSKLCELCGKGSDGELLQNCTTAPNQNSEETQPKFTEKERSQSSSV